MRIAPCEYTLGFDSASSRAIAGALLLLLLWLLGAEAHAHGVAAGDKGYI